MRKLEEVRKLFLFADEIILLIHLFDTARKKGHCPPEVASRSINKLRQLHLKATYMAAEVAKEACRG